MLTAKNIIEMEESIIHNPEPRKRSDTLQDDQMSSEHSSDPNPALVSRRASVPMEIIIGENGKPIFTASSSSTVGSPVLAERRNAPKKASEVRSNSKKRNPSVKKKKTSPANGKTTKKTTEKESPEDLLSCSLATCSIGVPIVRSKHIEQLPEYETVRTEKIVTVRDASIQTDLF
ncbi:unnamed protein product [Caenorhabditis sp. 36 PRJEB53466]|nr:unnamed protein product [Caenorhabditis sp. 36 PRJEB53466]